MELTGLASKGVIHLINSGPAALDGTGEQIKQTFRFVEEPGQKISTSIGSKIRECL
jgi:L-fucose isomerase-like protein